MNQENDYQMSFFRPTTKRALRNRNLVIWLVSIWTIAIFGFHIVLRIIEKPTPEPELISFNQVWPEVRTNNATEAQLREFALAALHVTGKVFIEPDHRLALDNGITWAMMQLANGYEKDKLLSSIERFNEISQSQVTLTDKNYQNERQELTNVAIGILQIEKTNILASILPFELREGMADEFSEANRATVEKVMPLYLTHNRSVLTDTTFLGFPFHYFYTAVFLLVLFIGLCYAYCVIIDRSNKELNISE